MNIDHFSADLKRVDDRLCNWSRWAYSTIGATGRCGSVEHRYRPDRYADGEAKMERTAMPIDALDAAIVERAICRLDVHSVARRFVRSYYEKRHDWRKTCRILHVHWSAMEETHRTALYILLGVLHDQALRERGEPVKTLATTATAAWAR